MLKVGTTYNRIHFNSNITVKEVITHKKESGNRKVKLETPVYIMTYDKWVSLTERKQVEVPMTEQMIKSQLSYNLWEVVIK